MIANMWQMNSSFYCPSAYYFLSTMSCCKLSCKGTTYDEDINKETLNER